MSSWRRVELSAPDLAFYSAGEIHDTKNVDFNPRQNVIYGNVQMAQLM